MTPPDRAGDDSELALDEGQQGYEAEIPCKLLGLIAEVLEVRVVHLDNVDLRTFCIGFDLDRLPAGPARRAVLRKLLQRVWMYAGFRFWHGIAAAL